MAEVEAGRFSCSGCGKSYRWKPELAGKKAKCKCGVVMEVPLESPAGEADEGLYDMAPEDNAFKRPPPPPTAETMGVQDAGADLRPRTKTGPRVVSATSAVKTSARAGATPVLSYCGGPTAREVAAAKDNDMMFEGNITKNLYLPIGLILIGIIIQYGQALYWSEGMVETIAAASIYVGITVFVNVTVMLIGIFVAAKFLEISFGPVMTAILKLVAIAIAPGAIGEIISIVMGEGFVASISGAVVSLILYYALFSLLFSLDFSETLNCVMIIWVVRWLTGCFLMAAIMGFVFSR